jgi:hypothetical protein
MNSQSIDLPVSFCSFPCWLLGFPLVGSLTNRRARLKGPIPIPTSRAGSYKRLANVRSELHGTHINFLANASNSLCRQTSSRYLAASCNTKFTRQPKFSPIFLACDSGNDHHSIRWVGDQCRDLFWKENLSLYGR